MPHFEGHRDLLHCRDARRWLVREVARRSDERATRTRDHGNRSVELPRRSSAAGVANGMRLPAWSGEILCQDKRIAQPKERETARKRSAKDLAGYAVAQSASRSEVHLEPAA